MWIETPETPVSQQNTYVDSPYGEVRTRESDHPKPSDRCEPRETVEGQVFVQMCWSVGLGVRS